MSKSTATHAASSRPLSPHLTVWKPTITYVTSIVHRITGAALYFGTLLVAWWLVAAATSERQFDIANWVFGSWIGMLVLFGYTWALLHHMAGGVRHLIWDTGAALDKNTAKKMGWATVAFSVTATILVWIAGFAARGAF
jgi:succinate dehydrogenase / fumarate reductase, cytochrome b subunit